MRNDSSAASAALSARPSIVSSASGRFRLTDVHLDPATAKLGREQPLDRACQRRLRLDPGDRVGVARESHRGRLVVAAVHALPAADELGEPAAAVVAKRRRALRLARSAACA